MKFTFAGVFADAGALFRANRDLLLRVAGVFLFLPALAAEFFLPMPQFGEKPEREEMAKALVEWFGSYGGWIGLELGIMAFGGGVILVLLLDASRPTLGEALAKALRLLPALLIGWFAVLMMMSAAATLLLVVGLYIGGRVMLTGPVIAAEPATNPFKAVVQSIWYTTRKGWLLTAGIVVVAVASQAAAMIPASVADVLEASGATSPLVQAPLKLLAAAATAAGWLALLLLQSAAYRLVKQGT